MDKIEKIRTTIDSMDENVLKDAMAIILGSSKNDSNISNNTTSHAEYKNFAQAILDLKRKFNFPELNFFTTEADLVYVQAGDRKILLTDKETMYKPQTRPAPEKDTPTDTETSTPEESNEDSMENAFENIKPSDTRFSHLEF